MTLIKSISGFRGTIGGKAGENFTPVDIVTLTSAYAQLLKQQYPDKKLKVVVGRDARISGEMAALLVIGSLLGSGVDVVNIGLATTPSTELAVVYENADGGIILTASHNPKQWNALKLLNSKGEFLNNDEGKSLLQIADKSEYPFPDVDETGKIVKEYNFNDIHIKMVLNSRFVDADAIIKAKFKIVVDAVNSVGGIIIPQLLKKLGVDVVELNCEPTGNFAHNPEPLPENLTEISKKIIEKKADIGIVVDPDVDRLALVCENGKMFGEEYTLVSVADYVLSKTQGNAVSNISSSQALRDVAEKHGGQYFSSAVGEVNVVAKMKEVNAVIGGEGNGGVIFPEFHYGRDALIGIALFLTNLANKKIKASELRSTYPDYFMSKNKIELTPNIDIDKIFEQIKQKYSSQRITNIDGIKIDFDNEKMWVLLRKSNTEPIIRIYSEACDIKAADRLAKGIIDDIILDIKYRLK
ncbi:MAG: phosphoglucosamine mutase [Prevotellaceae bacterium]|jgi:phosphomannomutase|nr:phosphoglucosamine mutase [Prevotellaceae bacterium]